MENLRGCPYIGVFYAATLRLLNAWKISSKIFSRLIQVQPVPPYEKFSVRAMDITPVSIWKIIHVIVAS